MLSGAGTFGDQEIAAHSGYTASVQCSIPTGYRVLIPFCYGLQWYTVATLNNTSAGDTAKGIINVIVYNTYSSAQICSAQAWFVCIKNKI